MEAYMQFLVAIYEANSEAYATIGLTNDECRMIISETIYKAHIAWQQDELDDVDEDETGIAVAGSPAFILNRLIQWGWLYRDFDEKLNCYVLSFPEYSQLYVELFAKMEREDDSQERESLLSIYSALFTYQRENEKNSDMLRNAYMTSKKLGQLLSNMQDGMRNYFEDLSNQKDFRGIQEVLIQEINNKDSKKYAILTTTDSFYRYKEEVKELIDEILADCDKRRIMLKNKCSELKQKQSNNLEILRHERLLEICDNSIQMVNQIEREFNLIERKYNHLVSQKTIFAKRALARIHYILQDDNAAEDNIIALVNLLDRSSKRGEVMEKLQEKIKLSVSYKNFTDNSIYQKKQRNDNELELIPIQKNDENEKDEISDFIPKPLYTKKQLQIFREKNMKDGIFETTLNTVKSVDDLEKLLFIWQEATNIREEGDKVFVFEDLKNSEGLTFSQLRIYEDSVKKP